MSLLGYESVFSPSEVTGGWKLNWVVWNLCGRVEKTWMSAGKWIGTRAALIRQDSSAASFGWQSIVAQLSLWWHTGMGGYETWERNKYRHLQSIWRNICRQVKNISKLGKLWKCVQTKTKYVLAREVMQSANYAPSRRLKMCWWMALLSLALGAYWYGEEANG